MSPFLSWLRSLGPSVAPFKHPARARRSCSSQLPAQLRRTEHLSSRSRPTTKHDEGQKQTDLADTPKYTQKITITEAQPVSAVTDDASYPPPQSADTLASLGGWHLGQQTLYTLYKIRKAKLRDITCPCQLKISNSKNTSHLSMLDMFMHRISRSHRCSVLLNGFEKARLPSACHCLAVLFCFTTAGRRKR